VWSRTLYIYNSVQHYKLCRSINSSSPAEIHGEARVRIQWADDSYAGWSYGITVCRAHNNIIFWVAIYGRRPRIENGKRKSTL